MHHIVRVVACDIIIIEALGGYWKKTSDRVRNLLGPMKGKEAMRRTQKAVLNSSLNTRLCIEQRKLF